MKEVTATSFSPPWFPLQDYELQLMTYRAFVESQQKSPMKRRRMLSSSDAITQEVGTRLRPLQGGSGVGGSSTLSKSPSSLCEMSSFLLNSLYK